MREALRAGAGTVLYLVVGGGYSDIYIWKNCTLCILQYVFYILMKKLYVHNYIYIIIYDILYIM